MIISVDVLFTCWNRIFIMICSSKSVQIDCKNQRRIFSRSRLTAIIPQSRRHNCYSRSKSIESNQSSCGINFPSSSLNKGVEFIKSLNCTQSCKPNLPFTLIKRVPIKKHPFVGNVHLVSNGWRVPQRLLLRLESRTCYGR